MNITEFLYRNPVFRLDEFLAWKKTTGLSSKQAAHSQLQYHIKTGHLMRIRRELYAVIPPGQSKDNLSVDPYLVAAKVTTDSTIAFHSALELFGVAYSSFNQKTYLSSQKTKPFEFQDSWFQPVKTPNQLSTSGNVNFEIESINRQGVEVKITSLHRTFVDVLNRVQLSGGWEEVARSISNISTLNINRVVEYCQILNSAILAAKVGYFLELRQGAFAPTTQQTQSLLDLKPSTPQYLTPKKKYDKVKLVSKWNIFLPISVIDQNWEDPNHDI